MVDDGVLGAAGCGGRPDGPMFIGALAFVAGFSVLVRPELALMGGLALIMMLIAARDLAPSACSIVVAGGFLPVAYEIFRMGYYGLLVPGTALAKDAAGDKWSQGMIYLVELQRALRGCGCRWCCWCRWALLLMAARRRPSFLRPALSPDYGRRGAGGAEPARGGGVRRRERAAAGALLDSAGRRLHARRVLLAPLFCLLAPVAVIPVAIPDGKDYSRETGYWVAGAAGLLWLGVAGWSLWAANSPGMGDDATHVTYSGIVDERRFYAQATGHAHPLTAADYLDYPRMAAVLTALNNTPNGALLLPSGNYIQWDLVPMMPPPPGSPPNGKTPQKPQHTVFFTNLGMVGMNVGLDVRVIDQIGLANPIAQHTERLKHGRIGHDKNLFPDWVIADGPWVKVSPGIPGYLDAELGRPGGGGAAMPRDQGGTELGASPDDPASLSCPTS